MMSFAKPTALATRNVLIMRSFATELATPSVTDVRTYVRTDTLPRLIYKDSIETFDGLRCKVTGAKWGVSVVLISFTEVDPYRSLDH